MRPHRSPVPGRAGEADLLRLHGFRLRSLRYFMPFCGKIYRWKYKKQALDRAFFFPEREDAGRDFDAEKRL